MNTNPDETKHQFLKHENCQIPNCAICAEEVKICTVCGGIHTPKTNSLTTHCPGKPLTAEQKEAIEAGYLDYKNFRWHDKRIGPTIKEVLKEKNQSLEIGDILETVNKKRYICIGIYENSLGDMMYAWHEIMHLGNREDVGFVSLIHYKKFVELFGEL